MRYFRSYGLGRGFQGGYCVIDQLVVAHTGQETGLLVCGRVSSYLIQDGGAQGGDAFAG